MPSSGNPRAVVLVYGHQGLAGSVYVELTTVIRGLMTVVIPSLASIVVGGIGSCEDYETTILFEYLNCVIGRGNLTSLAATLPNTNNDCSIRTNYIVFAPQ